MAFVPVCKRERAEAASQAVTVGGGSAIGVGVGAITAVAVGVEGRVAVDAAGSVTVGEGRGVSVDTPVSVAVGEGRAVGVEAPKLVALGKESESIGVGSAVSVRVGSGVKVDSIAGLALVESDERGGAVDSTSFVRVSDNGTDVSTTFVEISRAVAGETNSVGESELGEGAKG